MMSPRGAAERVTADALDRYWDSLATAQVLGASGGLSRPDELLDPTLTRSVRQVRMIDATPHPEPGFASQLWADLMAPQIIPSPAPPSSPTFAARLRALPRPRVLVELAVAAALLLVVLGGGAALELPVALDPAVPTAAASAGAAESGAVAGATTCPRTVTPEPTQATRQRTAPLPTIPSAPTVSAVRSAAC
jgi:hypothetical protein